MTGTIPESEIKGRRARDLQRDAKGNAVVEFALILPAVLIFILGIMQTGVALWNQNELNYAVEEAARCASINLTTCGTPTQIASFAAARSSANFDTSVFTATTASCGNQVSASYPMQLMFPFTTSVTLTAQFCYPTQS